MIFETQKKVKLQYSTWGNLKSRSVVLFFHGFPGSHVQAKSLEKLAVKMNLGLVAVDRPGYGHSTFIRPGDYKTHLNGILELLDRLEVKKLVKRNTSATDKRETVISLTNAGINILEITTEKIDRLFETVVVITDEQASSLNSLLENVREKEI